MFPELKPINSQDSRGLFLGVENNREGIFAYRIKYFVGFKFEIKSLSRKHVFSMRRKFGKCVKRGKQILNSASTSNFNRKKHDNPIPIIWLSVH